jgi:beta-lactamase class A
MVRRTALLGGVAVMLPWLCRAATIPAMDADILAAVDRIERSSGGRLGVAVLNISTGRRIGHRAGERFAMCSTFKCLAAACVLARVDRGIDRLDRRIVVSSADLVHYAPVTERRIGGPGMTLGELCEAAVTVSDNTAANLLLAHLGGPAALTSYARALGDDLTRLDRIEPALNDVEPGDARDTTTPDAMLDDLRRIVLGNALSPSSRDRIVTWLVGNRTGDARLRAGLPRDWRVGDKTGTWLGRNNATNDIAVVWPRQRGPLLITAYLADSPASEQQRDWALADVARVASRV